MQQLPPFPDDAPGFDQPEPSQPGQPTEAPTEAPSPGPDIDVPDPGTGDTGPSPTPISPIGAGIMPPPD